MKAEPIRSTSQGAGQDATFVALLHSVVLPGAARLKMADLRAMAADLGYADPRTVGSSGNLLIRAPEQPIATLERTLGTAFAERFGKKVPIIVLTMADLKTLLAQDPLGRDLEGRYIYIRVMREGYSTDILKQLAPYVDDQILALAGGHLWIAFKGNAGGSRLLSAFSTKRFAAIGTFRSRAMLEKIAAAGEAGAPINRR